MSQNTKKCPTCGQKTKGRLVNPARGTVKTTDTKRAEDNTSAEPVRLYYGKRIEDVTTQDINTYAKKEFVEHLERNPPEWRQVGSGW